MDEPSWRPPCRLSSTFMTSNASRHFRRSTNTAASPFCGFRCRRNRVSLAGTDTRKRGRPLPPRRALGAKFYAGVEDESMRAERRLSVIAGSTRPRLPLSALVGKQKYITVRQMVRRWPTSEARLRRFNVRSWVNSGLRDFRFLHELASGCRQAARHRWPPPDFAETGKCHSSSRRIHSISGQRAEG